MNTTSPPLVCALPGRTEFGPLVPKICWAVFIGILLASSIPYAVKASQHGSAFVRWHNQIQNLASDADIYLEHNYPNPPMMALLLYPLVLLPPVAGALGWYFLKVGLSLLAMAWCFRLVGDEHPAVHPRPWVTAVVLLLALRPFLGDLSHGNVNLFILFLIVAALYLYRRQGGYSAGLVLALAIACKVTPVLFLPYFLWKRAWKTLAGVLIGLLLFLVLVPGLFLGMTRNVQLLHSWSEQMVRPFVASSKVLYTEHNNQSLPATVLRLTTASPSFSEWIGDRRVPLQYHNLVDRDPATAGWIVKGCFALFCMLVCATCRTENAAGERWRHVAEFSLVLLGMLLFSERTWKHHCVLLLLPYTVLVHRLASGELPPTLHRFILGMLLCSVVLIGSTSTGWLPDETAKLAQAYGAYVWAHLLLAASLVLLLLQPERHGAVPPGAALPAHMLLCETVRGSGLRA